MTKKEKLRKISELRNPFLPRIEKELVQKFNFSKGEKGDSIKGDKGDKGDTGDTGEKGDSIKGDKGDKGDTGYSPVAGRDFWTEEEKKQIMDQILSLIPAPQDGISPKIEDIIAEIQKNPVDYKDIKGAPDLSDVPKLIDFLKSGGFRGGGLSSVSHDTTLTGNGTPGSPLSVSSSGSGNVTGPASSTDKAVARFNGTTGKIIQDSSVTISDAGNLTASLLTGQYTNLAGSAFINPDGSAVFGGGAAVITNSGAISGSNLSGTNTGDQTITLTGDVTGSGTGTFATALKNTGPGAGSYTNANLTLDNQGRVTLASNGTAGTVTSVSVASSNGFAGTSSGGATPILTLATSVNAPALAGNGTAISAATTTGTGSTVVLATSPTLVTPALGTPTALVATNATGTAAGLTAGTVTTNANLTGAVTSVGNAASLGSFSSANLAAALTDETGSGSAVFATSPTISGASLGSSTATTQAPTDNSTKVATTAYVDAAVLGQNFKEAAKYATTTALPSVIYNNGSSGVGATITAVGLGAITIDSVTPTVGDRLLIKNQADNTQNGIYVVTVVGTAGTVFVLTRSTDANQSSEFKTGDSIFVVGGAVNSSTTWAYTGIDSPTIGAGGNALTYAQTAGQGTVTAGNGITITGLSVAIDTSVTVDKTTAQALTNKDLTGAGNTFPTFNQNTSGTAASAAKWTTARLLAGNSADGTADVPFANKFIVQGTADAGLTGAQFLGALGTGIIKNTTSTGVLSIAVNSDLPAMSSTVGGAVPTPPNDATKYLNGTGAFSTPAGVIQSAYFGDGSDGALTTSTTTTLTRSMFYSSITVNSGGILKPAGFRIFCSGTTTVNAGGSINNDGNPGSSGSVPSSGIGGSGLSAAELGGAGVGGSGGMGGSFVTGSTGGTGVAISTIMGGNGGTGGTGGTASAPGGAAVNPATGTVRPLRYINVDILGGNSVYGGGNGGAGGSGGGGAGSVNAGAGGGGGGGGGGVLLLMSKVIVNAGTISCLGGNGGNGGTTSAGAGNTGGGGGGGSGGGGSLYLGYTSITNTGTISAAAGNVGTGGVGHGTGISGSNGQSGGTGYVIKYNVTSGAYE